jgi:hypothetical protein
MASLPPVPDAGDARCDRCGGFATLLAGDRPLCEECYRGCGSCCPEFGQDDLWPRDEA